MSYPIDSPGRALWLREKFAAERAKRPTIDADGRVPAPAEPPATEVAPGPRTPAPDPTQGARGPGFTPSREQLLDQQIAAAEAAGNTVAVWRLQRQKQNPPPNPWPGATPTF